MKTKEKLYGMFIRVTEPELNAVREMAKKDLRSVNQWIRIQILKTTKVRAKDLPEL